MATLDRRIVRLEQIRDIAAACACRTWEIVHEDGTIENEAPDCCPHGRPWLLVRRYDLSGHGERGRHDHSG